MFSAACWLVGCPQDVVEFQRLVTLLGEFVSFPTVSSDSGSVCWEDLGCGKARPAINGIQKMVGRSHHDLSSSLDICTRQSGKLVIFIDMKSSPLKGHC